VLRVGTFNGEKVQCATIQEAVNAVEPGGWILIGPGDYKQSGYHPILGAFGDDKAGADILITTPNIHVRGMNRNTVMIDGTKPGSSQCSFREADQNFGPAAGGSFLGNNGIVVYKANGVWLQNFSACNFLGADSGGDAVWFDGGGATGKQGRGAPPADRGRVRRAPEGHGQHRRLAPQAAPKSPNARARLARIVAPGVRNRGLCGSGRQASSGGLCEPDDRGSGPPWS